jgi:SAM-dependent methyltransferase
LSGTIYEHIVESCETDLDKNGDNFLGVGWTKKQGYAELRYRIMLEGIRPDWPRPLALLDFGCGLSHLKAYLDEHGPAGVTYDGLDLSAKYLECSRRKYPGTTYHHVDLMAPGASLPDYDFIVLNGLFNYKGEASQDEMWEYCSALLEKVWPHARLGIAFNVMSKYVDWEREDLFHLPLEQMAEFVTTRLSRHFSVRYDYGLFEYTVYVYRTPLSELY